MAFYVDMSKAFDTVNHNIPLMKLHQAGVRGVDFDLFRTYLTDRKQYVEVDGMFSTMKFSEIPQGSNLGPLLFLLYLNYISRSSEVLNFVNCADDTIVFFLSHPILDALYT